MRRPFNTLRPDMEPGLNITRPARILVAEGDGLARGRLAQALRGRGYEVIEAASGQEVLERLDAMVRNRQRNHLDLLISAVALPGKSGLEVMRLSAGIRDIPVILLSAPGEDCQEEARRLGALAVVSQPVDLEDLIGTMLEVTPVTFLLKTIHFLDRKAEAAAA